MTTSNSKYIWQRKNWTDFSWQSEALISLLGEARQAQGKILAKGKSLGFKLAQEAQAEILVEETVKTAAIEGEILDRNSVRSSVARRLGLSKAGLPPAERHVDGLVEILLDATQKYGDPLTVKRLKGWHAALFPTGYSGLHKIRVGEWREGKMEVLSGPVGKEKVHFLTPPSKVLNEEAKNFLNWWKNSFGQTEGFLRAGVAHFWFVTIHPFDDGNGRITRALTDMALAQDEQLSIRFYSFSSQILEERSAYYDILEKSQKGNRDITAWLKWFLGCLIRSMEKSETLISKVLVKAKFWQEHSQTSMNERQRKIVNRLLDVGKGECKGGLTTKKYVSLAKTSRTTAFREISDLVEKNVLIQDPESKGRNVKYDLNWSLVED
ncbi:MAG: Fic family protein [Candidatus Omnitrophica bacterium]|nr:Fic family protein [Candidatus Omnitrophota bacterium]